MPTTSYQQRSPQAALLMFLDTATRTALHRAELISKSLLNEFAWDTEACWALLEQAQ